MGSPTPADEAGSRPSGGTTPARAPVAVAATAGALWHTLACLEARGRVELLPAFRDHIAFIALAPAVGADAAVRELARARREAA
jgi:hypothetical protein